VKMTSLLVLRQRYSSRGYPGLYLL